MVAILRSWLLAAALACTAGAWAAPAAPAAAASAAPAAGELRVVIKPAKPFAFEENGQWKGYSVELWKAAAEQAGLRYTVTKVDTVPEALAALKEGRADVAVGALSITEERERQFDFTHPFYESGLQILAPVTQQSSILVAINGLLSAPVAGGAVGLVLALIVVSWLLWRLERNLNEESFPAEGKGFGEAVWWSVNTLIAGGCENKAPVGWAGRSIAIVWMLGGIAFTSYITAVFTSTLTVNNLNSQVRGLADLQGQLVGTVDGSSSEAYLARMGLPMETHENVDEAIAALLKKDVKAVVYDAPLLRYWQATHPKEGENLQLVGEIFDRQHYGYALKLGSPQRKVINEALLQLRAQGAFDEQERKWFSTQGGGGQP